MDTKIKRILIVDDEEDLCEILQYNLGNEGYITEVAHSAEEALRKPLHNFDLLLLDVMMGSISGFKMADTIRKEKNINVPIIFLTAKDTENDILTGFSLGADDYIPKPFNLKVLQLKIVNLIESRRKLKRMFSNPGQLSPSEVTSNAVDEEFLARAYEVLEKNYSESEFSASQFASEMFVSQSLLYKKIKAITDLNISDFINSYKLKKAIDLIKMNDRPISDIAFSVGFNDPKYFSRKFKKFYGMTPSEFSLKS